MTYILLKDTKNTGLLIFNSLKQKKLIFNFFVNRNWNKLTDSRKRAKILADNPKKPSAHWDPLKDESLGLPSSGLGVIKADVIVSSIVVETDFDAVTAAIIV